MVKDSDRQDVARIETRVRAGDRDSLLAVLVALVDFPDREAARRAGDTALLAFIDDGRVSDAYARLQAAR